MYFTSISSYFSNQNQGYRLKLTLRENLSINILPFQTMATNMGTSTFIAWKLNCVKHLDTEHQFPDTFYYRYSTDTGLISAGLIRISALCVRGAKNTEGDNVIFSVTLYHGLYSKFKIYVWKYIRNRLM